MYLTTKQCIKISDVTWILRLWVSMCSIIVLSTACVHTKNKPSFKGQWYVIQKGDTLSNISQKFAIPLIDIIEINHIVDPSKITVNQKLFLPSFRPSKVMETDTLVLTDQSSTHDLSSQKKSRNPPKIKSDLVQQFRTLQWPLKKIEITSAFGQRNHRTHKGIDLRAKSGTHVYAVSAGTVIRTNFEAKGYGWYIVIRHGNGLETRYAHHRKNRVEVGESIKQGQHIADVGSSGKSTAPHLHFEIRLSGESVDPLIYLPAIP